MFARKTKSSNGNEYLYIVKGVRDGKRVKHETIAKLGNIKNLNEKGKLKNLLVSINKFCDSSNRLLDPQGMKENDRVFWGAKAVTEKLWKKYQFDKILKRVTANRKVEFDFTHAILLMLIDRFTCPCSKLQTFLNQDKHDIEKKVDLHHFYRALDILAEHKDDIEIELFKQSQKHLNMAVNVVFYDVTTLYFESVRPNDLLDFGYSKDCKFGEVQVVVGLLVTHEGVPIGIEVFPGNTYEGETFKVSLNKLKTRFKINKVIVVADQGMLSDENLQHLQEHDFEYIIGSRIRSKPNKIKEDILDLSQYKTIHADTNGDVLKAKSVRGYDRDLLNKIKSIVNSDGLKVSTLREIRKISKELVNSKTSKKIKNFIVQNFNDPAMIIKLVETNKTDSTLSKRINIIRNNEFKVEIETHKGSREKILDISKDFINSKKKDFNLILDTQLNTRYLFTWSSKRKEKNRKDRERLFKKAEDLIEKNKPIIGKKGFKKYIDVTVNTPQINHSKKALEEQWDGFFGIQTNNNNLTDSDITDTYHMLWKIEESFRILKSHLETRPVYHWSPKRIKGHLVLCFFALLMERILEIELNKNNVDFSVNKIREAIISLQASIVEIEGIEFYLRSNCSDLAKNILSVLKIKTPANMTEKESFEHAFQAH